MSAPFSAAISALLRRGESTASLLDAMPGPTYRPTNLTKELSPTETRSHEPVSRLPMVGERRSDVSDHFHNFISVFEAECDGGTRSPDLAATLFVSYPIWIIYVPRRTHPHKNPGLPGYKESTSLVVTTTSNLPWIHSLNEHGYSSLYQEGLDGCKTGYPTDSTRLSKVMKLSLLAVYHA